MSRWKGGPSDLGTGIACSLTCGGCASARHPPTHRLGLSHQAPFPPTHHPCQELVAEKGAVFFMYPRANTGGCTKQACGFRDNYKAITDAGFDVYGLSFDSPKVWSAFSAQRASSG